MPQGPFSTSSRNSSIGSFEDWVESEDEAAPDESEPARGLRSLVSQDDIRERAARHRKERRTLFLMLACACCLSVGSHFGSYILGPIKARLKTSEGGFSSLVSASQLVNTITPLFTGYLVPKLGAARCGLMATGAVFGGQLLVVLAQTSGMEGSVGGMVLGLIICGLGISPLAVVQESIILASKGDTSKSVARSVAIGLLLGKSASFVAAVVAEPLAEISDRLPFMAASSLSFFSFLACVAYASLERSIRLPKTPMLEGHRAMDHPIRFGELPGLGDPFWIYIGVCALAGLWSTSIHLSTSLLKTLYDVSPARAATVSSSIPFSSIVLYPAMGWLLDKHPKRMSTCFITASTLMFCGFAVLRFCTAFIPIYLAIIPLALGIGPSPLLLVVVVPRLVDRRHVSTALGIHKSAEMAGAVVIQGSCTWLLSASASKVDSTKSVVTLFLVLSAVQLALVTAWWRQISRRENETVYGPLPPEGESRNPLHDDEFAGQAQGAPNSGSRSAGETARGKVAMVATGALVVGSWGVFAYNYMRKG